MGAVGIRKTYTAKLLLLGVLHELFNESIKTTAPGFKVGREVTQITVHSILLVERSSQLSILFPQPCQFVMIIGRVAPANCFANRLGSSLALGSSLGSSSLSLGLSLSLSSLGSSSLNLSLG